MATIRTRLEKWFENLAHAIYRHRILSLLIMLVLSGILIVQIPKITIDTSTEGFLHDDDPALLAYNAFRDQFGRDEVIIIAIKPEEVFDHRFLKRLKALHEELEDHVPFIEDITSLINARSTRGESNELIVEDTRSVIVENTRSVSRLTLDKLSESRGLLRDDSNIFRIEFQHDRNPSLWSAMSSQVGFSPSPFSHARILANSFSRPSLNVSMAFAKSCAMGKSCT